MTPHASNNASARRPLVYELYAHPLSGPRIEELSFQAIDRECPSHNFSPEQWIIVRRMIHTCADFTIKDQLRFSSRAIASGVAALRSGKPIYVDSNMIKAGISLARLQAVCSDYKPESISAHVADADIAQEARNAGLPRSLFAIRKAKSALHNGIVIIGNAPVALLELNRMILEEGIKPALVIAMPVGFIHVTESKQELLSLDVPAISLEGRRGGSTLAVSVLHSLATLAGKELAHGPAQPVQSPQPAIILLGHGSRLPDAATAMEKVAQMLRGRLPQRIIEFAHMSLAGPRLEEVFAACVSKGVNDILVMPYFLHDGMHMKMDIPKILIGCLEKLPNVRCVLGKCLGYDEVLVDLVGKRIHESTVLPDIRTLKIVDEVDRSKA